MCQISKTQVHAPIAVFTSQLVARHCFSLLDLIVNVALPLYRDFGESSLHTCSLSR